MSESGFTSLGFKSLETTVNESKQIFICNNKIHMNILGFNFELDIPYNARSVISENYQCYMPTATESLTSKTLWSITASIGKPAMEISGSYLKISAESGEQWLGLDALLAMSKLLEKSLNESGRFSIHAASIAYGNFGTLIAGSSGVGKTTSAVYSAFLDKEVRLVSGNRVMLDEKLKIMGGAPMIRLRKGSIISELNPFSCGNLGNVRKQIRSTPECNLWDEKISLLPEEIGVNIQKYYPININTIFIVKKLDKQLSIKETKPTGQTFLTIYNAFSEFSDNFPNIGISNSIPYPDFFGTELRLERAKIAKRLCELPIIQLEGRLKDISSYITDYIRT